MDMICDCPSGTRSANATTKQVKSVELFTGAGGLALGCAKAGFHHLALVEQDKHSCHTLRQNQQRLRSVSLGRVISLGGDWLIHNMDVTDFDYSTIREEIDFLAGGPPCQPFSIGGRHGANSRVSGICSLSFSGQYVPYAPKRF